MSCDNAMYDVATGRSLGALPGFPLAHSADGQFSAGVVNDDDRKRRICVGIWQRATGRELARVFPVGQELSVGGGVTAAALTADGGILAIGVSSRNHRDREQLYFNETVYLYDAASGKLLRKFRPHPDAPRCLAFSPTGDVLATSGLWMDPVQLWQVATDLELGKLQGQEEQRHRDEYRPIAFSPDGKLLAAGGKDNHIVLWETATGQEVQHLTGHQQPVRALAFAPDGRALLTGAADTTGLMWAVAPPRTAGALTPADLDRLWTRLSEYNGAAAYRAAQKLASAPEQAVGLFKERLKPLPEPDLKKVPRLLADLDNDAFAVREAATRELAQFGPLVAELLQKTLAGKPPIEVQRRVELVLSEIQQYPIPSEQLRQLRAIQVLEWLGTPVAADRIEVLARPRDPAAYTRCGERPAPALQPPAQRQQGQATRAIAAARRWRTSEAVRRESGGDRSRHYQ